ncbi:MAG TPA: hypothetical protein VH593_32495, partial [Ktedonobacteraceae bacterium]
MTIAYPGDLSDAEWDCLQPLLHLWQPDGIKKLDGALFAVRPELRYHSSTRRVSNACSAQFCVSSRARSAAARACSRW